MKRDPNEFPEIVDKDGEVLTPEFVAWSLSREGRRAHGKEYPNPVPLEPPIGYQQHVPLHEQLAQMVRRELAAREGEEVETEDEANDFEVDDDYDPHSPWELTFEPTMPWREAVAEIMKEAAAIDPPAAGGGGVGGGSPPDALGGTSGGSSDPSGKGG